MSDPLHVVAVITGKPGSGDQLEVALAELTAATHRHEGCLLYSLQRGTQDRDVFVTVEKWASAEHLQQHLASSEVRGALSGPTAELLAGAPQIISTEPVTAGDAALSSW